MKGTILKIGVLAAAALAAVGCARSHPNAMLEQATASYTVVSSDPQVVANAPVELNKAGESLQAAMSLWEKNADAEMVTHQAYLANQQAAIALEAAQLKAAQEQVARADAMRQQVLLDVRSREAELARQQAEARQQELQATRQQAQQRMQEAQVARQQAEARQRELEAARLEAEQRSQEAQQARMEAQHLIAQAEQARQQMEQAQQEAALRAEEMQQIEQELADLQARQTPRGIVLTLQDIVFEVGKADLKSGAERSIDKIAAFLQGHPGRTITVEGFTDSTGSDDINLELSEQRAQAVAQALVERGVSAERIQTRGFGESYPVASNDTAAGRQLNRRVEIVISAEEQVSINLR